MIKIIYKEETSPKRQAELNTTKSSRLIKELKKFSLNLTIIFFVTNNNTIYNEKILEMYYAINNFKIKSTFFSLSALNS